MLPSAPKNMTETTPFASSYFTTSKSQRVVSEISSKIKRVDQQIVLIPEEKQVLVLTRAVFSGYSPQGIGDPVKGYQSHICKAFETCNNTVNNVLVYFTNRSFSME